MSDLNDDIAAAITSLGGEAPASAAPVPVADTSKNEVAAAVTGQQRNPDGTFAGAAPAASGAPAAPAGTGAATPTPGAPSGAAPAASGAPAASAAPAAPAGGGGFDHSKPPSGWTADMKAKWDGIPEDVRKEIQRREEASYNGFEKFRKQTEPAVEIYDHLSQYGNYFAHINAEPKQYLSNMIQMEQTLALGNPAQKMETMMNVADFYGIPLRQIVDSALQATKQGSLADMIAQGHQRHGTPAPIPQEIQQELAEGRRFRQEYADREAERELAALEADTVKYPLLSEACDAMADLIEAGKADSFEEAYELAVWRSPELRARSQAIANGQQQNNAVAQRQAAAASVSTPAAPAAGAAAPVVEPDSTEDSIRNAINKLAAARAV